MNIDKLLNEKSMTKAMLAEKMGIRSQNVNVALKNPTEETIRKIAVALGVEVWELFTSKSEIVGGVEDGAKNGFVCPKCGARFELKEE